MNPEDILSGGTYEYIMKDCSCETDDEFHSPHPYYTAEVEGKVVEQISMITLGGFNGLNN